MSGDLEGQTIFQELFTFRQLHLTRGFLVLIHSLSYKTMSSSYTQFVLTCQLCICTQFLLYSKGSQSFLV